MQIKIDIDGPEAIKALEYLNGAIAHAEKLFNANVELVKPNEYRKCTEGWLKQLFDKDGKFLYQEFQPNMNLVPKYFDESGNEFELEQLPSQTIIDFPLNQERMKLYCRRNGTFGMEVQYGRNGEEHLISPDKWKELFGFCEALGIPIEEV